MTSLALASVALTLTPDGEVQIGGVTMPAHAARWERR